MTSTKQYQHNLPCPSISEEEQNPNKIYIHRIKMTMVNFKQKGKGKETILKQINARHPDQVLHPHWENWGRGWELRNHTLLILPKPKHSCTRGADTLPPRQLLGSIHFLLPVLNVVLFGQEDFFTHCSFEFIVWLANWRQTSPTHRIIHFFCQFQVTEGKKTILALTYLPSYLPSGRHSCDHFSVET